MHLFKATNLTMHFIHKVTKYSLVMTIPLIYFLGVDWKLILASIVVWQVFFVMGYSVGVHRYFSHRSFECNRFWQWTLGLLGIAGMIEPPSIWATIHRIHHKLADTDKDPYVGIMRRRDKIGGATKSQEYQFLRETLKEDPMHGYMLKYYWLYIILFAAGLTTVGMLFGYGFWESLYWLYITPAALSLFGLDVILWTGHVKSIGYRNYETDDTTNNCWVFSVFAGGEGWHNNHHAHPREANLRHKWWEFDLGYQVIKAIRK